MTRLEAIAKVMEHGGKATMCWCSLCVGVLTVEELRELAESLRSTANALDVLASFAIEGGS